VVIYTRLVAVAKKIALSVMCQLLKTVGWSSLGMFHLLIARYDETITLARASKLPGTFIFFLKDYGNIFYNSWWLTIALQVVRLAEHYIKFNIIPSFLPDPIHLKEIVREHIAGSRILNALQLLWNFVLTLSLLLFATVVWWLQKDSVRSFFRPLNSPGCGRIKLSPDLCFIVG
jgi:hypothetical protein